MTLSLSGGPKGAGAQGRGDRVQGQSLGGGSGALPQPGRGGMGAGVPPGGGVRDAVLGGGQTTQKAARTASSPPCKIRCGKNVLNPQTQTRFARHKLQGRFGKEFATRKAVTGWMLNIWDGDLQALCSPCLGRGDAFFSMELGQGSKG